MNEDGETVTVKSFSRRGTTPARVLVGGLSDPILDFTSWAYALFQIYLDDLKNSPCKRDSQYAASFIDNTAKSEGFKAINHTRAAKGKPAICPEEFLLQYSAETFQREVINQNYKVSTLKDIAAAGRCKKGNGSMDDISRLFQNCFFRNPSFDEGHPRSAVR